MSETEKKAVRFTYLPRALAAWAVCAVALLLSASVLYASDTASLSSLGYASSLISFLSAIGAGAAASGPKEGRAFRGLLTGLLLSALLLLTGFLVRGRLEGSAVLSIVSFTLTGCLLGSLLPAKKKKRLRARKKR